MKFTKTKSEGANLTLLHTEGVRGFKGDEGWIGDVIERSSMFRNVTLNPEIIKEEGKEEFRTGKHGTDSIAHIARGEASSELIKLAGKKEGAVKAEQQSQRRSRRRRKDEFDGEVDVDSFLAGDPDYYRRVKRVNKKAAGVQVIINITQPAATSTEELMQIVINALNVAYGYAARGVAVEIKTVAYSWEPVESKSGVVHGWINTLKEGNRPFDLKRIYTAAYPAYFRGYGFNAYARCAHEEKEVLKMGLGCPINSTVAESLDPVKLEHIQNTPGISPEGIYFDEVERKGKRVKDLK